MKPTVSIIIATYNRAHFILETLLSIQNQIFSDWECFIIDDGGADNTLEIITPILKNDSRFSFFKRTEDYKKGLPGSRNYGLDLAKGQYVVFFDDDDLVNENLLKAALKIIEDYKVSFCHYQKQSFEDKHEILKTHTVFGNSYLLNKDSVEDVLQHKIGLASCTVLWNRNCFENIRFNENLMYAEEWECYSRILSENFSGVAIHDILYYNRKHATSNTSEFYQNSPMRRASKVEAILLVLQNLKEKELLSNSILRYFITMSSEFKEFDLFSKIIHLLEAKKLVKIKWKFYYYSMPLRMPFYKIKKSLTKNS